MEFRLKRQIRESISIHQHNTQVMNRDKGSFELPRVWDSVIPTINLVGGGQEDLSVPAAATDHQVAAQF